MAKKLTERGFPASDLCTDSTMFKGGQFGPGHGIDRGEAVNSFRDLFVIKASINHTQSYIKGMLIEPIC
jgi:hypothetical protein